MITQNKTLLNMASEIEALRSQVTELEEKVKMWNSELEREREKDAQSLNGPSPTCEYTQQSERSRRFFSASNSRKR